MKIASTAYDSDPGIDFLERAIFEFDRLAQMALTAAKEQLGEPACSTCSSPGCCHGYVMVSLAEALPMARRLLQAGAWTSDDERKILSHIGDRMLSMSAADWWLSCVPCLLLEPGAMCSFYDLRPVQCRAHFAWGDPGPCQPPSDESVKTVDMLGVARSVAKLNCELAAQLGLNDQLSYVGPLPRMLAVGLDILERDTDEAVKYLWGLRFPTKKEVGSFAFGSALISK